MKKITFILIFAYLGVLIGNAQDTKVDLTFNLNGKIKSDSVYLFLYSTTSVTGQRHPKPEKEFVFDKLKNSIQVYPGAYTLATAAFGYKQLSTRIYIPPVKNYKLEIEMNPQIIGWGGITETEQINFVALRGDFNNFRKKGEILLEKTGDIWKLEKMPEDFKQGHKYSFFVNDQETTDLRNSKITFNPQYISFNHYYDDDQEIIFDPSLYSLVDKDSELIPDDSLKQNQFKKLVSEINSLEKEKFETFRNVKSRDVALLVIDSLLNIYDNLENNYSLDLSQMIIDKKLGLVIIKYLASGPEGNRNDEQVKNELKKYFLGEEPSKYIKQINVLLDKLDPNSFLVSKNIVNHTMMMQNQLNSFPEIAEKHKLSENYYQEFLDNFVTTSTNKKLCYSILMTQANFSKRTDETKTKDILESIKNNPDYEQFLNKEEIESMLAKFNIKLGSLAPEFSVTSLNGESIKLSDYSGKFVFIDFWGSWCAPCRKEIPHLKKLYSSVTRDKLVIIGLAQDDETKLRNYIKEQNIEYPNVLASKGLLAKYGISKFPTSFLINPKGKIVRIDVRGADAMEFIGDEIEDYFN